SALRQGPAAPRRTEARCRARSDGSEWPARRRVPVGGCGLGDPGRFRKRGRISGGHRNRLGGGPGRREALRVPGGLRDGPRSAEPRSAQGTARCVALIRKPGTDRLWEAFWNARLLGRRGLATRNVPSGLPSALAEASWNAPPETKPRKAVPERSIRL